MRACEIALCFNACFGTAEQTHMVGGADEPLYLPAGDGRIARLSYREDFAASALHEAAHWCIAGRARRRLIDFGYRYLPPPRSADAQARFFAWEVKAQSLERIFARAANVSFTPSADNLQADVQAFALRLEEAQEGTLHWLEHSPDGRARRFHAALRKSAPQASADAPQAIPGSYCG